MNKQELIKKIEEMPYNDGILIDTVKVNRRWLLRNIEELELEKVKVSEEEAKFLKTFDFNCESDVTTALYRVSRTGWGHYLTDNYGIELKDLSEGFRELKNRERLIKAILDGYEVEEEKRYLVKVKGMQKDCVALKKNKDGGYWYLSDTYPYNSTVNFHTRKELEEAGFGWVFDCEGIELVEVE
ncbi:DUF1642 domain-containing protein [Streptococcus infantis]|uniref:DUF1642 domain-containing protein n=1 Tax=Streptococcus infantis TaxID=68892 RepID=UPI0020C8779F|nr:DUF1642 domain-containing protein [Streptococcus infantis]MCP9057405.1 DUF1642 domain-containing protein [Streptococcus infantis]MCP9080876.1 DUF1642 domain-containing protein [Streptococcus infantis]